MLRRPAESAQYNSLAFGNNCEDASVRPSTGSVGDAYDNAMCESFSETPECKRIIRNHFRSHSEARMAVFSFNEGSTTRHAATRRWATAARLRALERKNRELRQANEILRKALAYFAQAELGRRYRS